MATSVSFHCMPKQLWKPEHSYVNFTYFLNNHVNYTKLCTSVAYCVCSIVRKIPNYFKFFLTT